MISKVKAIAVLLALGLITAVSMGAIEIRLIQDHFHESSVTQVKFSAEQLAGAVADLKVPAENSETCQEVAAWVGYNTGMRVLITESDSVVVVDTSTDNSLVGEPIESEMLKSTMESGVVSAFDLVAAGEDEVAVSVPWQTGDDISGALIIVGPLKAIARNATNQMKPFIMKSGLMASLIAVAGAFLASVKLSYKDGNGETGKGKPIKQEISVDSYEHERPTEESDREE